MAGQVGTLEKVWAPQTLERVLEEHPLLKGCQLQYIQLLVECASNVRFDAGETIPSTGQSQPLYLIRQGKVALEIPVPPAAPSSFRP
jgi:hypothetical protein